MGSLNETAVGIAKTIAANLLQHHVLNQQELQRVRGYQARKDPYLPFHLQKLVADSIHVSAQEYTFMSGVGLPFVVAVIKNMQMLLQNQADKDSAPPSANQ